MQIVLQGMDVRFKLVADCMEALLGVAFIHGGLEYATHTLVRWQLLDESLVGPKPDLGPEVPECHKYMIRCAALSPRHTFDLTGSCWTSPLWGSSLTWVSRCPSATIT